MISGKEVLNFCKLHDYYVYVHKIPESNGCYVEYPASTAIPPLTPPYQKKYVIGKKGITYRGQEDDHDQFFECAAYARRILVFNDIYMKCTGLGIGTNLISWNNIKDGEEVEVTCFDEVCDPLDSEEERLLEQDFSTIFYSHIKNPFADHSDKAEKLGVLDGYRVLKKKPE